MTKDEALRLALEALEKLWNIIDDIDTYSDMAKADEKLYRSLVERRQRQRFEETGISTDGYELHGGAITAIKAALLSRSDGEAKDEPVETDWERIARVQNAKLMAVCDEAGGFEKLCEIMDKYEAITPTQRTWVGLTDEEIAEALGDEIDSVYMTDFRRVEAKLKDKNYD